MRKLDSVVCEVLRNFFVGDLDMTIAGKSRGGASWISAAVPIFTQLQHRGRRHHQRHRQLDRPASISITKPIPHPSQHYQVGRYSIEAVKMPSDLWYVERSFCCRLRWRSIRAPYCYARSSSCSVEALHNENIQLM